MTRAVASVAPNPSLTQQTYERLRADLLACRRKPGSRLNTSDLSDELKVSLGAVREALSRLSSEGLVAFESRRGFRVTPLSTSDMTEIAEARLAIETECLRRAIEAASIAWEAELLSIHHRLSRTAELAGADAADTKDEWTGLHREFHTVLVSTCNNARLTGFRCLLYDQADRYRRLAILLADDAQQFSADSKRDHQLIVEAAIARNTQRAVDLLAGHIRRTHQFLLESGCCDSELFAVVP
jgi:DNA-binding GntR family transcriptional regulator